MSADRSTGIDILVVEDVEEMRELLKITLEGVSTVDRVRLAADVPEARLELSRSRPDVIFLDEIIPGESSLDLLEEVFQIGIPVLLVTEVSDAGRPIPQGALTRLSKPGWESIEEDRERFGQALAQIRFE